MMKNINPELKSYIETNIFPEYELNNKGHGLPHIMYVLERSLRFAETVPGINFDMVYTIACYHDVKDHVDRSIHEKLSAEALSQDKNLLRFFMPEQITIMAEAVCDHRCSCKSEPRSIYGKIVSSADRDTSVQTLLQRYHLSIKHETIEERIQTSYDHLLKKYNKAGYGTSKMYFPDPNYETFLRNMIAILENKTIFRQAYMEANGLSI